MRGEFSHIAFADWLATQRAETLCAGLLPFTNTNFICGSIVRGLRDRTSIWSLHPTSDVISVTRLRNQLTPRLRLGSGREPGVVELRLREKNPARGEAEGAQRSASVFCSPFRRYSLSERPGHHTRSLADWINPPVRNFPHGHYGGFLVDPDHFGALAVADLRLRPRPRPFAALLAALALPVALGGAVEHQPHAHDCPA